MTLIASSKSLTEITDGESPERHSDSSVIGTLQSVDLVQRGGAWAGCGSAQSPSRSSRCNSPSINGQFGNFILFDVAL